MFGCGTAVRGTRSRVLAVLNQPTNLRMSSPDPTNHYTFTVPGTGGVSSRMTLRLC
jgi:hypothetical protein